MSNNNTAITTTTTTASTTSTPNTKILFQLKTKNNNNIKNNKNQSNQSNHATKPSNFTSFIEEYDSEKEEEDLLQKSKAASQKRKRENKPLIIPVADKKLVIDSSVTTAKEEQQQQQQKQQPILLASRIADLSSISNEKEKLQKDLSLRAADISETSNVYYNVPVEEFGAAMLRGMGWQGSERELNKEKDDDLPRRYYRLGLGAVAAIDKDQNKDDKTKNSSIVSEKEEEKKRELCQKVLQVESIVTLPDQPNRARVLQTLGVPGLNQIKIQYEDRSTPSHVNKRDITLVSYQLLLDKPFFKPKEDTPVIKPTPNISKSNSKHPSTSIQNNTNHQSKPTQKQSSSSWLAPNIKVRIISKSFSKGKYYKQKGVVLDTPTPNEAFIQIIGNKNTATTTVTVPQQYLETIIPKVSSKVMILKGRYKNQRGIVNKRNFDKGRVYVQLLDHDQVDCNDIVKLDLEDVSEYCGDLDD